jgi:CRISPR-associated protein Cmx8
LSGTETITLSYDLFTLPSAQHKAGLAGLLIHLRSLTERRLERDGERLEVPVVQSVSPFSATITITRESIQTLFDDLYDARTIEIRSQKKFGGKEPKAIAEDEVSGKKKKVFLYDVTQPKGAFFEQWLPGRAESPWLRLWREMVWTTLRAIPATRGVYEERADGQPSSVARIIWSTLVKAQRPPKKGKALAPVVEGIASSLAVGVQDVNAEKVSFQGGVERNLLLHFWQLATLIFTPRIIDYDGKAEFKGFVLAIPEVANLEAFVAGWVSVLKDEDAMSPVSIWGRPKQAIIDLPGEAGLEYLYHLSRHALRENFDIAGLVSGVELYRLEKQGNSVRMLACERVPPARQMIKEYEVLRDRLRNPYFKVLRLTNLLRGEDWFRDGDRLFAQERREIFIRDEKAPRQVAFFGIDVRAQFDGLLANLEMLTTAKERRMADQGDVLAKRVYKLIRTYVRVRVEDRTKKKLDDVRARKTRDEKTGREYIEYPKDWVDAVSAVCTDAFLAIRGRAKTDFIEYFAGTIFAVPQFLPEDDFVSLSRALRDETDDVKTLALMALSAQSAIGTRDPKQEESKEEESAA